MAPEAPETATGRQRSGVGGGGYSGRVGPAREPSVPRPLEGEPGGGM
jgi:hypothetical protein